ncbi:MAG TPA: 3-hydroxyacyl-CoA dehydrogenase NAD-binding domain-containing protein, partial [Thermoanaerobaculia bacterium]
MPAFNLVIETDGLAVLTFDLPSEKVNKFSRQVLTELAEVLARLQRESSIRSLLLASGKPDVFIAGADIKEFVTTKPDEAEKSVIPVQALFDSFTRLPYPTVAAVNGACLGGGTEMALTFDFRLMSDSRKAQIGLPEVRLGIFPAWGGCTRLPRLVGLPTALDLILTGKTLDARRAKKIGLVDEAVPAAIFDSFARTFTRQRAGEEKPDRHRRSTLAGLLLETNPIGRKLIFVRAREGVMKQTGGHYPAPLEALKVIEEGYGKPVEVGLAAEARHIGKVFGGPVQKNLLALFLATEEIKKETGVSNPGAKPRAVLRVGVLGAGLMGGGIAYLAADRGIPARMKDIDTRALAHGFAAAAKLWQDKVRRRRMTTGEMAGKMALLSGTLDYTGFARCEVTIEAVVEKLTVKRAVLKEWEAAVPRTAIFASNTSTLPISQIASEAAEPSRVVGMHFFNPVHRMPLVEVIRGEKTSDETVATIFGLAKTLGKTPVVVADRPGFLVNRILAPYLSEAVRLVQEGSSIETVDETMTRFGMPVGPIALLDDVGLDTAVKAGEILQAAFPERMVPAAQGALAEAGRLGRKAGKGFYDYEKGKRRRPAKEAYAALGVEPVKKEPPPVAPDEILARLTLPMINEAAYCLAEGVVADAGKLDLAMIFGTGFPPFRGGLLRYADSLGAARIEGELRSLAGRFGSRFTPS